MHTFCASAMRIKLISPSPHLIEVWERPEEDSGPYLPVPGVVGEPSLGGAGSGSEGTWEFLPKCPSWKLVIDLLQVMSWERLVGRLDSGVLESRHSWKNPG